MTQESSWHRAGLKTLDQDLLEFGPPPGIVSLQFDVALIDVLQLVVFEHGIAIDPHQAVAPLYHELKGEPDLRLDLRIDGSLEGIERAGRIVRALHVMQLDFVVTAAVALPARTKQNAAVVMLYVPHEKLELEIAELLLGRQVPGAVGMDHAPDRLKFGLAFRDEPFVEIFRRRVESLPAIGGR